MSFYFKLKTSVPMAPEKVLAHLDGTDVSFSRPSPELTVFYVPGSSLRGVNVYNENDGPLVGINAFTTHRDALLTRDIVLALATIHDCPVQPEDQETPIRAHQVTDFCDDRWITARQHEARAIMETNPDMDDDEPTIMFGYARPFAVSKTLVATYETKVNNRDQALRLIMEDAQKLQEIDKHEDIFVPQIMEITDHGKTLAQRLKNLFFRTAQMQSNVVKTAFVLSQDVRTLTPVISAPGPIYAVLGSSTMPYRAIPLSDLEDTARNLNAREFCVGAFDLTVSGQAYQDLYDKGAPI